MSDKPKPGKDKDVRYIRQALDATQRLLDLLGVPPGELLDQQTTGLLAELMLVVIDQIDELDQMISDPTVSPVRLIEQNRQVRKQIRQLLQQNEGLDPTNLLLLVQNVGNQLTSLLVIKEIRRDEG